MYAPYAVFLGEQLATHTCTQGSVGECIVLDGNGGEHCTRRGIVPSGGCKGGRDPFLQ